MVTVRKPNIIYYKNPLHCKKNSKLNTEKMFEIVIENCGKSVCENVVVELKLISKNSIFAILLNEIQLMYGDDFTYDNDILTINIPISINISESVKITIKVNE